MHENLQIWQTKLVTLYTNEIGMATDMQRIDPMKEQSADRESEMAHIKRA